MIEIEGTVTADRIFAREGEKKGDMSLHFTLSPWRRLDRTGEETGRVVVAVDSDLDYVDAWMRDLGPGDIVRVTCVSLDPDENGDIQARAVGEPMNLVRARGR